MNFDTFKILVQDLCYAVGEKNFAVYNEDPEAYTAFSDECSSIYQKMQPALAEHPEWGDYLQEQVNAQNDEDILQYGLWH